MMRFFVCIPAVFLCFFTAVAQQVTTITSTTIKIDDQLIFDAQGNLYGSNYDGSAVFKRTPDGTESIFASGFNTPNGMAYAADSSLILCDPQANKVYQIAADGSKTVFISTLTSPSGIIKELDSDTLIISAYSQNKMWKVAPDGVATPFVYHSEFNGIFSMCYDDSANLYLANYNNAKIFKVTPDGQIAFFSQLPGAPTLGFLAYSRGHLYATAFATHKIYKLDLYGNYYEWLGSGVGNTDGDSATATFNRPNGILFSRTGDTLYISDYGSKRVRMITDVYESTSVESAQQQVWGLKSSPNPVTGHARLSFVLPAADAVTLRLFDDLGREVATLLDNQPLPAGPYETLLEGAALAPGRYFLKMQAQSGGFLCQPVYIQ